jgi:hypothetical protein
LKRICLTTFLLLALAATLSAQDRNYTVKLTRGKLWHSFYLTQDCGPMGDWTRVNFGLDWPGFNPDSLKQSIGGANSYLVSGGFYIAALNDTGGVWGWSDFATKNIDTGVDWSGASNKYLVTLHEKKWKNGENYWLQADPQEAEELITTKWEMNTQWFEPTDNPNLPIAVRRDVRQWSGSMADENYVIIDYTIRNIQSRKPLNGVYLLFTHAVSPNHRGWNLLFPNLTKGARNTQSRYYEDERMVVSWADDFLDTPGDNEQFDYFEFSEYDPVSDRNLVLPEYVAPAAVGVKFLYISPDSTGTENRIRKFAWSAGAPMQDTGPFQQVQGVGNKYNATGDPMLLTRAFSDTADPAMGSSRLYTNFAIGPFDIPRRDSIRVVLAEFVGGISYEKARDSAVTIDEIKAARDSAVTYLAERAQAAFDNGYQVPMPPPAPEFAIHPDTTGGIVANLLTFSNQRESIPDPHQGETDIAGYRVYRSRELPIGPWELIADIPVASPEYFNPATALYSLSDQNVAVGFGYYYSVTAYDNGHDAWPVTGQPVEPLESSLYANRKGPFRATLQPTRRTLDNISVVPNPLYRNSGLLIEGEQKYIQFGPVSEKCTLRIYTLRGDLVKTIEHNNAEDGFIIWNQVSDYGQYVKSGMYFYHITNQFGDVKRGKFAIVN